MTATIHTLAYTRPGNAPILARVAVDILRRLPGVVIVGLPAASVRETADTARAAMESSGVAWPRARVVVTIEPADATRVRSAALAICAAVADTADAEPGRFGAVYHGHLRLDGTIQAMPGVLDAAILARDSGIPLVCGMDDAATVAAVLAGVDVLAIRSLTDLVDRVSRADVATLATVTSGGWPVAPDVISTFMTTPRNLDPRALATLRALQPGQAVAFISDDQPIRGAVFALAAEQAPTMAAILAHDRAGLPVPRHAPVRAPHETIQIAGMIGEVGLADGGWIVLDPVDSFRRATVDVLRGAPPTRIVLHASAPSVRLVNIARDVGATVIDLRDVDQDDEPTERIERSWPTVVGGAP